MRLIGTVSRQLRQTGSTCEAADIPDSEHVSIFVRRLRACVLACALIFMSLFVFIFTCLTVTSGTGVQLITAGAKPQSRLCDQHKAGCPSRVSHSLTPQGWPLGSRHSCLPHKPQTMPVLLLWSHLSSRVQDIYFLIYFSLLSVQIFCLLPVI